MTDHDRFQQFTVHQPKRKRAGLVCILCHEKKIKCDLQETTAKGFSTCSNCAATGNECRHRPSNRDKRRRISKRLLPPQSSPDEASGVHQNRLATPPFSAENGTSLAHHAQEESVETAIDDSLSTFAGDDLYRPHVSVPDTTSIPAVPTSREPQDAIFPVQYVAPLNIQTRNDAADSYLGETGFLEIYGPETRLDADRQVQNSSGGLETLDLPPPELQQGFQETYFEFCYTWCPVLDQVTVVTELAQSPLLLNALALAGSHVQPPIILHAKPSTYYDRAKQLFYGDKETDLVMCLKSIALFYWWSPQPPSRVHRDSSWWWTTAAIRHAQHAGFHREPKPGRPSKSSINPGLRRRIWWTLFARERLTALCQDRPCVIDPEDCNVLEPTLDDFRIKDSKAEVFIQWVRLCAIIGRVAKYLSRSTDTSSPFPVHLAKELIFWVQTLPENLALPIRADRTTKFNRDIHQLHLPYLAVIIVLHLNRSSQPLPMAYPAAILAASCIARIFKDCMARGKIRYFMAISCWYCGIALLALLQARRIDHLVRSADEDIKILVLALKELSVMWPTANIFLQGFERLQKGDSYVSEGENMSSNTRSLARNDQSSDVDDVSSSHGIDWTQYFPHATVQTSGLASLLYPEHQDERFIDEAGLRFITLQLNELFDPFDSYLETMPALPVL